MNSILDIISIALRLFQVILFIRVLLSWFPGVDPYNPLIRFVYNVTEPVLRPIRQAIPPERTGMMDISPIVVILGIIVIQRVLL